MRKVASGQRLQISASTFNTMMDAAADFQRRSLNRQSDSIRFDTKNGIILVRNQSGADRERFEVLGLSSVLITPTQNAQELASRFAFNGVLPAAAHAAKFAILQEPIKSGAIGSALIVGITPVLVRRAAAENSEFAGIEAGQLTLRSGKDGAQILWEENGPPDTVHLAIVRMPHQQAGGSGNLSVRVASTANVTPTSASVTTLTFSSPPNIDGIVASNGNIVLLKNQTTPSQNGPYRVGPGNVWTREGEIKSGMLISIRDGIRNFGTVWLLRTNDPITVGTTPLLFASRPGSEQLSVRAASGTRNTPAEVLLWPLATGS